MEGRYSHLYKGTDYIPPSIVRKIQEANAGIANTFGETRVNGNNSMKSITGQGALEYLTENKLQNKDLYRRMKDKTIYSMASSITAHSALNNSL